MCSNDIFIFSRTLLNTAGMSFLGLDWADAEAETLTCNDCTFLFFFNREGTDTEYLMKDDNRNRKQLKVVPIEQKN